MIHHTPPNTRWRLGCLLAALAIFVAACRKAPETPPAPPPEAPAAPPASAPAPAPASAPASVPASPAAPSSAPSSSASASTPLAAAPESSRTSEATTPRAYRKDGAAHLYRLNAARIYKGRLPPHLYAIGVINVEIDRAGRVTRLSWLRAPRHAPEVIAEIERSIRRAAPFPVPARLGKVTYTDTWLWHKSGKFQLDTLTEGQD